MAQNYFQFKQFKISQDKTAMKVCTDACLFGAFVADFASSRKYVLDIGAGTGLLSLMYVQKNPEAKIDAIEIDKDACEQAQQNIRESLWKDSVTPIHQSVQDFAEHKQKEYDLIISNPPFFEKHLKSNDDRRNKALHSSELTLKELADVAQKLLRPEGLFAVLLPYSRTDFFIESANSNGLYLQKKILVKQSENHEYFRSILIFGKTGSDVETEMGSIKEGEQYSLRFRELLKEYYLYL